MKTYVLTESQLDKLESSCENNYKKKVSQIYSEDVTKFIQRLEDSFPEIMGSSEFFFDKIKKVFRDNISKKIRIIIISLFLSSMIGCYKTEIKPKEYLQPGCGVIIEESLKYNDFSHRLNYYFLVYMKTGPSAGKQGWIYVGETTYLNYSKGNQFCFTFPYELSFR